MRRGLHKPLFAGTLALVALWAVGQLARDWILITGLCFYIPSLFLAGAMLGWAAFHLAHRRRRAAVLSACLALLPLGVVLFAENHIWAVRAPVTTGQVRLVHWNVAGGLSPGARDVLLAKRAELYVLSEVLRDINNLIEQHQPDLVVGDFNAPRRSRALCELPGGYRHAYDTAGSGCGYTWPVPVPTYALDHCLHSSRIISGRYDLYSSIYSDHRLQVFDFTWMQAE